MLQGHRIAPGDREFDPNIGEAPQGLVLSDFGGGHLVAAGT
jgi:hypothetical protein